MANNRELSQFASFVEVGISSIGFTTSVGIGKTNPQFNLDVAGDINFTGTFYQSGTQFIASRWSATGSDIYRLSKVGINTSIVSSALTVNGDVSVSGVVTATTFIGAVTGTATSTTNIPNLTGAITSNNTTTSLGSFTSANLATALTDETGSGSAVFSTSPTLVTPVLGAASATSIVVSSGSTFTNGPVLIGSGTSTGTASQPLQVTGGAYVSGNLGVGITNPSQTGNNSKVHISGGPLKLDSNADLTWDGIFPTYIRGVSGSGGRIEFNAGNDVTLVYTSGSVGANISDLSPGVTQKIDLGRSSLQYRNTWIGGNLFIGTATSTGTASQRLQVTGGAYVSGSVGIGTTNPTSKLHVVGDVSVSGVVTATTFVGALTGTATSTTNIPNLTGAITSNNTTTSLGSFTSANLATALTDETGSGSAVFATSPTLVTPVLGAATATSVTVSGAITANSYNVGADVGISTTRTTVATTAVTTIDSFATATFRSTRAQVQITQSTNYQASDVLIIHDGTSASIIEYGSIATNDYLGTFSASVSGGNCLLRINMSSATSATVKVLSQRITV